MAMTAYDFTRFDVDFQSKLKAQVYETSIVAFKIEYNHKDGDIRQESEYKDAHDTFIELTMSCDIDEAKNWMKHWMAEAIAYGIQTKERDWQHKFLAAYDIFNSLVK